jgi:hypothetical protein
MEGRDCPDVAGDLGIHCQEHSSESRLEEEEEVTIENL